MASTGGGSAADSSLRSNVSPGSCMKLIGLVFAVRLAGASLVDDSKADAADRMLRARLMACTVWPRPSLRMLFCARSSGPDGAVLAAFESAVSSQIVLATERSSCQWSWDLTKTWRAFAAGLAGPATPPGGGGGGGGGIPHPGGGGGGGGAP